MKEQQPPAGTNLEWLRQAYFSNPSRRITLKKGELLLQQGQHNKRLFLILKGSVVGYLENEEGENFEYFRSSANMFVGVYSFFSGSYSSYATIKAAEDAEFAWIDTRQPTVTDPDGKSFYEQFLPIIVNEISARQLMAQKVAMEKESTLKKLLHAEKMATLGQLAAGLAHELNNAVGVLQRKTEWLVDEISGYLQEKDTHQMYPFFETGLQKGQYLSSSQVRDRRKMLEKKLKIEANLARKLAKTGMEPEELQKIASSLASGAERMHYYWEIGAGFHDMLLAARHAVHVVKSVKQLGVANQGRNLLNINETVNEALALLRSLLRRVKVEFAPGDLPPAEGSSGELVQVWLNIVKNGCEAMLNSGVANPLLKIETVKNGAFIEVRITDNGPGIPPDLLPRIFQPNVTTKVGGLSFGLGLGLTIVQRLVVENYDGDIQVESRPGHTMFLVKLPLR